MTEFYNDIIAALRNLLFFHEKVAFPGLGCFSSIPKPVSVHPVEQTFFPSSREIVFVSGIGNENSLLQQYLSQVYSWTESQVKERISTLAHLLIIEINKGVKVQLEGMGFLLKNMYGEIVFEQDPSCNFDINAFGLLPVTSPAIIREKTYTSANTEKKKSRKLKTAFFIIIPIVLLLAMAGIFFYQDIKSLLPGSPEKVVTEPAPKAITTTPPADSLPKSDTTPVTQPQQFHYYIVAGCFRSEANSLEYVEKLKQKGYQASIQGQTPQGLYRVCYNGYSSREEAETAFKEILRENPSAWIIQVD